MNARWKQIDRATLQKFPFQNCLEKIVIKKKHNLFELFLFERIHAIKIDLVLETSLHHLLEIQQNALHSIETNWERTS